MAEGNRQCMNACCKRQTSSRGDKSWMYQLIVEGTPPTHRWRWKKEAQTCRLMVESTLPTPRWRYERRKSINSTSTGNTSVPYTSEKGYQLRQETTSMPYISNKRSHLRKETYVHAMYKRERSSQFVAISAEGMWECSTLDQTNCWKQTETWGEYIDLSEARVLSKILISLSLGRKFLTRLKKQIVCIIEGKSRGTFLEMTSC